MTDSTLGTRQLIVLGNGFDLQCGLKSTYKDFFKQHFAEIIFKIFPAKERCDIAKLLSTDVAGDQSKFKVQLCNAFSEEKIDHFLELISPSSSVETDEYINEYMSKTYDHLRSIIWSKISGNIFQDSNRKIDYFSKIPFLSRNFNRWDIFFLFAELCLNKDVSKHQWQDVETLIYEIVSIALLPTDMLAKVDSKVDYKKHKVMVGTQEYNAKGLFKEIVHNISYTADGAREEIASNLLDELKKFEAIFAQFIDKQVRINQNASYLNRTFELIEELTRFKSPLPEAKVSSEFKVLSFNYSIDMRFVEVWNNRQNQMSPTRELPKLIDWANIHGIASYTTSHANVLKVEDDYKHDEKYLPAPIFGIDSREIVKENLEDDLRILFTKSYRIMDNGVNRIRRSGDYSDIDKISIYGHSLGEADYSYFETLFDEVNLYNSGVTVEYFYYQGKNRIERVLNKKIAIFKMFSLLTDYGRSLENTHGNNIVAKLNLEKRLNVIPMDYLQ